MTTTMELIHYGADQFDRSQFKPIRDDNKRQWIKPEGGLWTSPVDSEHGWRQWCESEDFHTGSLRKSFRIRFTGRLYVIHTQMDLYAIPSSVTSWGGRVPLWEGLMKWGFDAVHLTNEGQWANRHTHPKSLYGWDCETVLVMNPDTITPIFTEDNRRVVTGT